MTIISLSAGWRRLLAVGLIMTVVSGCAVAPNQEDKAALEEYQTLNDPFEPTNRAVFQANRALDSVILKPLATGYKAIIPEFLQTRVSNILANLRGPVIFANDVLQGEFDRAGVTFTRFFINSTIGIGGLNDMATALDVEGHDEDFGQTLAIWGVEEGPFFMLPVFGPSNPRDTAGLVVDFLIDPLRMWASNTDRDYVPISRAAVNAVDIRAQNLDILNDLENSSLDFYASIRSLYRQRRADAISNGSGPAMVPAPALGEIRDGPVLEGSEELSRR